MSINLERKTALITAAPRTNWRGTYGDSRTWASQFRTLGPHHFGLMGAQTFSTQLGKSQVNKPLYYMTAGLGNMYELPGGHSTYKWKLSEDGLTRSVIVDVDNIGTQPGKSGTRIRFALDHGGYHEPVVLKTEGGPNVPMLVIQGFPEQETPTKFWYEAIIQDGLEDSFIDPAFLQVGRTVLDGTTQVSDELNTKYGGIEFGSSYELQSQIGYVARKIEVTDKFIRLEKAARERGMAPSSTYSFGGKSYNNAVGTGYIIAHRNKDGKVTKDVVEQGSFISTAEAMLEERIAMDKEYGMTFGRTQTRLDEVTGRRITTGAGWFQIARDGNFKENNGNLTLDDFTLELESLSFNAIDPSDRVFVIKTGQDGMKFASQLVEAEAGLSPFVFDSSYFIDKVGHNNFGNERAFGAQFTEFRGYNGIRLIWMYDPTKDNPNWYPDLDEETGRPKESGSYDIFDLGATNAAPDTARTKSNCAYIYEPEAEEYFIVSNVYDIYNGSYKDGSKVANLDKQAGIYRGSSYKFECWDVSRTMRIEKV